jgi:hypothetical protein
MNVRITAMDDVTHDQNEQSFRTDEIPDDVLEAAACTGHERANTFTQWICTALYFCPGP